MKYSICTDTISWQMSTSIYWWGRSNVTNDYMFKCDRARLGAGAKTKHLFSCRSPCLAHGKVSGCTEIPGWPAPSINIPAHIVTLARTVFEILTFQIFDLQNLGQGHQLHNLQWCHSVANINLYKSHSSHFTLALTISEILSLKCLTLKIQVKVVLS